MSRETKSENRRALPKCLLIMLASAVCGGILGFCAGWMEPGPWLEDAAATLRKLLGESALWGIGATTAVLMGTCLIHFLRAKSRAAAWDGEDEKEAEAIDRSLNWIMLLSALQLLLDFFFFAAGILRQDMRVFWICGAFIGSIILVAICQQKAVDLTKRVNPEKRGSVYDIKFQKKWYDSCDEAEQAQIGRAAMHAYRTASRACLGLWLVLVVLSLTLEVGLLPIVVLMVIWGILQMSYLAECIRMSRQEREC